MADAELERAATAPLRWIALSSSKARNDDGVLPPRATRFIKDPMGSIADGIQLPDSKYLDSHSEYVVDCLYLVPGGRYLVASGPNCLSVWDLGYVSDGMESSNGKPIKIWATTVNHMDEFVVHPTPDGLGIRILTFCPPYVNNFVHHIFDDLMLSFIV